MNNKKEFDCLIEDGSCTDHGYSIPKQKLKFQAIPDVGVEVVDVSIKELQEGLVYLRKIQSNRLEGYGLVVDPNIKVRIDINGKEEIRRLRDVFQHET